MKVFYIEDENGKYISPNGERRFTRLTGKQAYDFLESDIGKGKYFFKTESNEYDREDVIVDEIYVEVPSEKIPQVRSYKNHEDYKNKCEEETDFEILSIEELPYDDGIISGEELIKSGDESTEDAVERNMDLERLHKAVQSLSQEEFAIIQCLYLSKNRLTESKLASVLGISQQAVNKRRHSILKELKNFFEL